MKNQVRSNLVQKLSISACMAVAVATVGLASDGLSSSIVGYTANNLRHGISFLAPCFIDVGAAEDGVDLLGLVPSGTFNSSDIGISELNSAGRSIKDYTYTKSRSGEWVWLGEDGIVSKGTVIFKPGQGLAVTGEDGANLVASGEVSTKDRVIPLRHGMTFTGNFTAVRLDLTSIIPGGEYNPSDIGISVLNSAGRSIKDYTFTKTRAGEWVWIDENGVVPTGVAFFEPNQGFAVTGEDGLSITIPGPTL